ncbi:hypothetical protein EGI31_11390 [Lacihabitans soyangensis]|uniref:Uncharacterized protein n=1 Tax=Lacihabitans soyangensis TaxID=869394 RepID=A0AAE3H5U4_9BACT|nr:hypothetical protein [Lacihabitans soyangensis]
MPRIHEFSQTKSELYLIRALFVNSWQKSRFYIKNTESQFRNWVFDKSNKNLHYNYMMVEKSMKILLISIKMPRIHEFSQTKSELYLIRALFVNSWQ